MADEPKVQPEGEPMQLEGAPEGAAEAPVQPPEQQVDIDGVVETLDKLQIRDAQHLEGIHRTASAHGSTAQELGAARRQIDNLTREMEMLKRAPARQQDPYEDPYEQQSQVPIDLRSEIRNELRSFYQDEVMRPQQEASQAYWRDVETAESSDYFPMVEQEYREHMSRPDTQRALAQGKTSHTNEFHKIVGEKFRNIAQNLKSAANMLKEQSPAGVQPPHMETGQVSPERLPEGEDARRQQLEAIQKEHRGTDDDLDAQLRAFLPDGDPILDI